MELREQFEQAVATSRQLAEQPNEILLALYGLYKQATEGDINIEKPTNIFDFKGIAKFNAWNELKGTSKEEAMKKYIDLVNSLQKA
ncbi:MAG: acyl-CoA-binding protein [Cytophagaceae bacterium]|nr:acyl-CoA-binding protein [Cytophagaceae bacterium]MDW8456124.1 acyl-CoA-binding protein [Cytophagaceae bacterium]